MFASPVVFAAADIDLEVGSLAPGQLLRNLYRCQALRMLHRGIHEHAHAGPLRRLLRAARRLASGGSAAKKRDGFPASHVRARARQQVGSNYHT